MAMTVGVPREVKDGERRVVLDPFGVRRLVREGHDVLVQTMAGLGAGFGDDDYLAAGARISVAPEEVWSADLVVKVKEPQPEEFSHFRSDLRLFCYLHLAAEPELTAALGSNGVEAHAFETVEVDRRLPLLAPMSEIAGRIAPIAGAHHLAAGSGVLMGGATGVRPARVVVIGLGVAGTMAARGAKGLDAHVIGVDLDSDRLRHAKSSGLVDETRAAGDPSVAEAIADADLLISAALVPGRRAPVVASDDDVRSMRHGSVIVDLSIDQGGSVATSRPTSISSPVYEDHGVLHYCVTNMPGQYPNTASRALSSAVAPWAVRLAAHAPGGDLSGSCNVRRGNIVHEAVALALSS